MLDCQQPASGGEDLKKPEPTILRTKLHRPPITSDMISREALIDLLEKNVEKPFSLVSAGPGYGKSVTVSQWLETTAWYVDVPPEHITEGKTFTTFNSPNGRLLNILFSRNKPDDAYVTVKLRKHWFYLDDSDLESKGNFTIVQILMSLTNDGGNVMSPLISIGN